MFEKEAEEYEGRKHYRYEDNDYCGDIADGIIQAYQQGAEFGYNKCKEELNQKLAATESYLLNAQKEKEEIRQLYLKAKQYKGESVFMFAVPQSNVFMRPYRMDSSFDPCAEAHYAERKVANMTDKIKIHLFDELMKKGFIKKYEPTPEETRYELRVLRWYE